LLSLAETLAILHADEELASLVVNGSSGSGGHSIRLLGASLGVNLGASLGSILVDLDVDVVEVGDGVLTELLVISVLLESDSEDTCSAKTRSATAR
jgi:hypothetical protein